MMAGQHLNLAFMKSGSACSAASTALPTWINNYHAVGSNTDIYTHGMQNYIWYPVSTEAPMHLQQLPQSQITYPSVWDMHGGVYHTTTGGFMTTDQQLTFGVVPNAQLFQYTPIQRYADARTCPVIRQYEHIQQLTTNPIVGIQTPSLNYYHSSIPGQYPLDNLAMYMHNHPQPMQVSVAQIDSLNKTLINKHSQPLTAMQCHKKKEKLNTPSFQEITCDDNKELVNPSYHIPEQIKVTGLEAPASDHHLLTTGHLQPTTRFVTLVNQGQSGGSQYLQEVRMKNNETTQLISENTRKIEHVKGIKISQLDKLVERNLEQKDATKLQVQSFPVNNKKPESSISKCNISKELSNTLGKQTSSSHSLEMKALNSMKVECKPKSAGAARCTIVSAKKRKKNTLDLTVKSQTARATITVEAKARTKTSHPSTAPRSEATYNNPQVVETISETSNELKTVSPSDHISTDKAKPILHNVKASVDTKPSEDIKSNLELKKPERKLIEKKQSIKIQPPVKSQTSISCLNGNNDKISKVLEAQSVNQSGNTKVPQKESGALEKRKKSRETTNQEGSTVYRGNLKHRIIESAQVFHPLGKKAAPSAPKVPKRKGDTITSAKPPVQVKQSLPPASHNQCPSEAKQNNLSMIENKGIYPKSHLGGIKTSVHTSYSNNAINSKQQMENVPPFGRKTEARPLESRQEKKVKEYTEATIQPPVFEPPKQSKHTWGVTNTPRYGSFYTPSISNKPLQELEVSIPITPEKREEREAMKRKAQLEREEACQYTSKGKIQFFGKRQEELHIYYRYGYPP